MSRIPSLFVALTLIAQAGSATIIIAVGTKDGLLVCEDRRLTTKSSTGKVSAADGSKAQQIGKFGLFAVSGDVSGRLTNGYGQSLTTFDILSAIPSFFKTRDIQQFNEQAALEFEAHLRDQLNKKPINPTQRTEGPRAQTEVLLYWMDQTGRTHLYVANIADALSDGRSPATAAAETTGSPRLVGRLIPLTSFRTSRPLVRGKGLLGYNAIATGTDPRFEDLRQDEELKPFLRNFEDAASIDSIAAVRSIKKLIQQISDRQDSLSPDGLDVGPLSDCFLGTADGIKNINQ